MFERSDNECRAKVGDKVVLFSSNGDIAGLDIRQDRGFDVVLEESYIIDLDVDPVTEVVYWVDSVEKRVKRSLMPHGKRPDVMIGAPQLLEIKGKHSAGIEKGSSLTEIPLLSDLQSMEMCVHG